MVFSIRHPQMAWCTYRPANDIHARAKARLNAMPCDDHTSIEAMVLHLGLLEYLGLVLVAEKSKMVSNFESRQAQGIQSEADSMVEARLGRIVQATQSLI